MMIFYHFSRSFVEDLMLACLKLAFCLKNQTTGGWQAKIEKYYKPLLNCFPDINGIIHICMHLIMDEIRGKISVLPRITAFITSRCPLNCEACAALIPYVEREDVSTEQILTDLMALESQVDVVKCIGLTGGEPFMHKDIEKIIAYLAESKVYETVEIASNGFGVLGLRKKVLKRIAKGKFQVNISYYGKSNRRQVIKALRILRDNNIKYRFYNDETPWWDFGVPEYVDGDYEKRYMECFSPDICRMIYKSEFYPCARGVYIKQYDMQLGTKTEISNRETFQKQLYDFYSFSQAEICSFCKYKIGKRVARAKQGLI